LLFISASFEGKSTVAKGNIKKPATPHAFRHLFATHFPQAGYDIQSAQELLDLSDFATTISYTKALNIAGRGVKSPLDFFIGPSPSNALPQ
jgi:integrase